MSNKEKKLTIGQSVAWNTWGNLLYYGTQWAITVLVARMLGYRAAGIYNLAMSITNIFAGLAGFGIRNYQISDINDKYSTQDYATNRLLTIAISFFLCVVFVLINDYDTYSAICICAYMVFRLSDATFDLFSAIYQRKWRLDFLGISLTIRSVLMICVFLVLSTLSSNILITIIGFAIFMNISVLTFDFRNANRLEAVSVSPKSKGVLLLLLECWPLAVFTCLSSSIASIPRYIMEMFLGEEALGLYASVAAPVLIVQLIATNIFNPMLTEYAECVNSNRTGDARKVLIRSLCIISLLTIVAIFVAAIAGRWGLVLLFGSSIAGYEYLLTPLICCASSTAIIWLLSGLLTVLRRFSYMIVGNGAAALVCLVLSIILINGDDGMLGATYALLVGNIVGVIILLYCIYISREVDERKKQ